ncbi:MAG: bifunctional 5,10-methylene-tetrahydrofolate dehydrogenase/5,10-methylene-tetrahydrofolate cyclohydrolase [Lachnospiraceae bacterium]|nr:bifunctional 5,10-methylene-tetrahydrofolate dehydrogenase/5,10-methylene-tetrahydrofolate cyclohydrolase [Lachnospiraceae bacterium]
MAKLLSGKEVAENISAELNARAEDLKARGYSPCLSVIRIGDRPGDCSYERGAVRRCETVGIKCMTHHLPKDVSQDELLSLIDELNGDESVHGVLLLRPLPRGMDEDLVVNRLRPEKDVDCMTDLSMSGLLSGGRNRFMPCTAEAAMAFFDYYGIDSTGMNAVIIGRSLVFGKPAALMLVNRNATVTVCHTRTRDLPSITRQADILITAAGHANTVTAEHVSPGQIVIDVGINAGEDGRLCGDAAFEDIKDIVGAITPVPGGVGAVTTSILARHVIEACEAAAGKRDNGNGLTEKEIYSAI